MTGWRRARVAALALVVGAAACGVPEQSPPEAFRVALLTPGSVRDGGWNQGAYEGLERIRDQLGAEIAHQETRTPQEFEEGFRDFAERGFDLVFGHGFEFQDAAARVGAQYPHTVFITTSGSTTRPNVAPIVFELEQATYVLGFAGGRIARNSKLGMVGGVKIPSVASTFYAFESGAKDARPNAEVFETYLGSWSDVAAAREATLALVAQGVDVLIHNANEAARGFFQAVQESPRVYAFGTNRNQNELAPQSVLASASIDIPLALETVAREVKSRQFFPRAIRFGLASGVIRIDWNQALEGVLKPADRTEVEGLVREIESGAFTVPRGDF
jgi:basic membrane lipoprotein Med (substrate-binding protein (PBP1-ABC) superfamily)